MTDETRKLLTLEQIEKWRGYCSRMWLAGLTIAQSQEQANVLCDMALAHLASGGCGLTEEMIDAPRYFILYTETPGRTLEGAREHMRLSGSSIDCWPDWAKKDTGHLTKSAIAILIWHMMNAAKPLPPLPKEGE